jgi:S-formylglutathione hydrolase FrmB
MLPWSVPLLGRIDELTIVSAVLRDNPLGDPHERPVWVQLPAGYDEESDRHYPVVYVLTGFGGQINRWRVREPYQQPLPELVDQMMADPDVRPVIVVYVDSWTAYGGSQFVDSPATGRYHTHLCDEIVPFVDSRYRTTADKDHRALAGKSSGGYGAMISPMLRPDLFGAFATHAGDALYETCYLREFPTAARALREYDGDIWRFWRDFTTRAPFTKGSDMILWVFLGIAACFSADSDGTVHLPFDASTGRVRDDIWERWLAWDPVRMIEQDDYADAMRSMRAIWIDAGTSDDYFLDLGAQAFNDGLRRLGVPESRIAFGLVDGNHWTLESRYPLALRWLTERLA